MPPQRSIKIFEEQDAKSRSVDLPVTGCVFRGKSTRRWQPGITDVTGLIKGYFATGVDLMYAIGAIIGLIGAIKVYHKWSAGEPDTTKVASSWSGACIFLVVVATVCGISIQRSDTNL